MKLLTVELRKPEITFIAPVRSIDHAMDVMNQLDKTNILTATYEVVDPFNHVILIRKLFESDCPF